MNAFMGRPRPIAAQLCATAVRRGRLTFREPATLGLIIITFIGWSTFADAQTNRSQTNTENKRICEQVLVTGKSLTVRDIDAIIYALEYSKLEKDEFETTASHQKRISEAIAITEQRNLKYITGWPLIVAVGTPYSKPNYDADKKQLSYEFKYGFNIPTRTLPKPFLISYEERIKNQLIKEELIVVSDQTESVGRYLASNAFGATVEVSVQNTKIAGISLSPGKEFRPPKPLKIEIATSPAEAKRLKDESQILYVAKLVSPVYRKAQDLSAATLQSPISSVTNYVSLVGDLICVALIDPANKKILSHLPLK